MKSLSLIVVPLLLLVFCTGQEVPGQCGDHEWLELLASDGATDDSFGEDVCVLGNRVVVGAPELCFVVSASSWTPPFEKPMDLCGLTTPHGVQGQSLVPLMKNPAAASSPVAPSSFPTAQGWQAR